MKSVGRNGIRSCPFVVAKTPFPNPLPSKPPFPIEYSDWMIWYPVVWLCFHGSIQTRDPLLHARHGLVDERGARDEEHEPGAHEPGARGRDVEHRQEDPEVEETAPEVVRLDEDEHRRAPDREQRAEVLDPPLGEHLSLLAQVAGQEDDQHDLRELTGLELDAAEVHPEARAVDRLADHGQRREQEEADRGQPEQVLVALEPPVVVAQEQERHGEGGDADDDPEALAERVVRVQPVDLGHADRSQERGHRQQVRVGLRDRDRGRRRGRPGRARRRRARTRASPSRRRPGARCRRSRTRSP